MALFFSLLTVGLNLFLGLLVWFKNKKNRTNFSFLLITLILSFWVISNYFSLNAFGDKERTLFWMRVVMVVTSFLAPVLFVLLDTFPGNKPRLLKGWPLYLLGGFAVLSSLISSSSFLFPDIYFDGGQIVPIVGPGMIIFALNAFIPLTLGFWTFFKRFKKVEGRERAQAKYFVVGLILTFVLFIISNLLFVVLLKISSFVIFGPLFSLIMVSFMAYAILKHGLLDIRVVVARSVSYFLLTVLLGGLYALGVYGISLFLFILSGTGEGIPLWMSVGLALILAYTFQPLRKYLEKETDAIFFKDKYDFDEVLYKLTHSFSSTIEINKVCRRFLKRLSKELRLSGAMLISGVDRNRRMVYRVGEYPDIPIKEKDFLYLIEKRKLVFDEMDEGRAKDLLRELDFSYVARVRTETKELGLLLLRHKLSGDAYTEEDLGLLKIVTSELAVAMQNAFSYEEIKRFSEILKDEVKKATSKLRETNTQLKKVSALKDEFVSLASHELRTPLTAIGGSISTILGGYTGKVSKESKEFLEAAYNENGRLIRLVNNLLNISRIEAGRLVYDTGVFNLTEVINEVTENLLAQAKENGLTLSFRQKGKDSICCRADKDKTREVLVNLVGNAIKYTAEGEVKISVEKEGKTIQIEISDTGPGMTQKEIKSLFKRFSRLKGPRVRVKGTGLGLYISKIMVLGMGGGIWVESVKGKGSSFYFTLPVGEEK